MPLANADLNQKSIVHRHCHEKPTKKLVLGVAEPHSLPSLTGGWQPNIKIRSVVPRCDVALVEYSGFPSLHDCVRSVQGVPFGVGCAQSNSERELVSRLSLF